MPNYIYKCQEGHEQELAHSITADPEVACPECQLPMTRKPQTTTVTFSGTGFYSTDA